MEVAHEELLKEWEDFEKDLEVELGGSQGVGRESGRSWYSTQVSQSLVNC